MPEQDIHNLQRFLEAQEQDYEDAIYELKSGYKATHWIWYVFPQVSGLGLSDMSQNYSIKSIEEAESYLAHPILGSRLIESCEALLLHSTRDITNIMGMTDSLKLRSSMTLFASLESGSSVFERILDIFYSGERDQRTISLLQ